MLRGGPDGAAGGIGADQLEIDSASARACSIAGFAAGGDEAAEAGEGGTAGSGGIAGADRVGSEARAAVCEASPAAIVPSGGVPTEEVSAAAWPVRR